VPARTLLRPVAILMAVVGMTALLAGLVGYMLADYRVFSLLEPIVLQLPAEKRAPYMADSFAHGAAYVMGFIGGIRVWIWAWQQRN